jgi:hypothetical protein
LHKPAQTTSEDLPHREYPSAAFLTQNVAFVSDGWGILYILRIEEFGAASLLGLYELPTTPQSNRLPFRLHHLAPVSSTLAVAILSSMRRTTKQADESLTSKNRMKAAPVEFDIWAVRFTLPFVASVNEMHKLDILWHRIGGDVPIDAFYDASREAYLLIGSSPYGELGSFAVSPFEPSPEEIAPIPRRDEDLNGTRKGPKEPPPYSWTQTADSVTVAFPLPSSTPTSNINVMFSPRTLTAHVQGDTSSSMPLPHYSMKELWDGINPSASMWTLDREGEHAFGLLTVHLDKKNEGTRWMQVFATSGLSTGSDAGPDDIEVPETLDPSELWHIRESLQKYTAALNTGEDTSGLSLGKGVPGLAEGEMDDEIDASVGRTAFLTWVTSDGSTPVWSSKSDGTQITILSTPVPGSVSGGATLIIKNALDGTIHTLMPCIAGNPSDHWTHTATFSALAFVLASKRDVRFTYHIGSSAVLAFENGIRDSGGNVYIYGGHQQGEKWAKQTVLKAGHAASGSLLGVGALKTGKGDIIILVLTENELMVIHHFL